MLVPTHRILGVLVSIVVITVLQAAAPCMAQSKSEASESDRTTFNRKVRPFLKVAPAELRDSAILDFERDAASGNPIAQYFMGMIYKEGLGRTQDQDRSGRWFRPSAEQGNADSMMELFMLLSKRRDPENTFWLKAAAERGEPFAQYILGLEFERGERIPKSTAQAYFWLLLASTSGNENAIAARDVVSEKLPPQERARIQGAAQSWRPAAARPIKYDPQEPITRRLSTDADLPDVTGSGFMVGDGQVVSNNHVIDGCAAVKVDGFRAKITAKDSREDLALLSTVPHGTVAAIRTKRIAVGESVAAAGFPLRSVLSGFNMTIGGVSSLSGLGGDTRLIQVSAPVQPGNSGGPLLDSSGNVAGVIVAKLDALKMSKMTGDIPQNVNFAINVNALRSFLDANAVDYRLSETSAAIPNTAVAEKAKRFTVLIECWK